MADNKLEEDDIQFLLENKDIIKEEYCGLNIEDIINKIETKNPPTFKEVASLINATHLFVEEIDSFVIGRISEDFYIMTLKKYLKEDKNLCLKYYKLSEDKRKRLIVNIFQNRLSIPKEEIDANLLIELTKIAKKDF